KVIELKLNEEEMDLLSQSATAVREVKAILDGMNS
ncbi:MAG: malate dehydrogenase, partial [Flavobacteriales bacterium]|nr:malate dehydrogenase [Flavobacteriales bacterium]